MVTMMKNKLFTWLLGLLLLANAVTLVFFWVDRARPDNGPKAGAAGFLLEQLKFSEQQQQQFEALAKDHRLKAQALRPKIREAKEAMFGLVKQPGVSDSVKKAAAEKASMYIKELDLYTLEHFEKVRAICDPQQQEKFDEILNQLTMVIAGQSAPGNRGRGPQGQPPGERREGSPKGDDMPPPPDQQH
jgi:Spy/CpxP family protein refolding chaperone